MGFRQESYTTFDEGREDPIVVSIGVIAGTLGFDFDFTVESATGGTATGKYVPHRNCLFDSKRGPCPEL